MHNLYATKIMFCAYSFDTVYVLTIYISALLNM